MLKIYPVHDRKNTKEEALIQVRVYFPDQKKRIYLSTGAHCLPAEWKNGKVTAKHPNAAMLNAKIESLVSQVRNHEIRLEASGQAVTPEAIKSLFRKKPQPGNTIKEFYHTESQLQTLSPGTRRHENRSIETFVELFGNLPIRQITLEHIQQFNCHLERYATDTRYNYHKHLKKYLNRALAKGIISQVPYQGYRIRRSESSNIEFLSAADLLKIESATIHNPSLERVRQRFLFCCYTGLSFADAAALAPVHVVDMMGARWIVMDRQKTGRTFRVPLIAKARAILNQKPATAPYFKPISNRVFNEFLKTLAEISGISRRLTSHMARHTFATTVALENGISLESLSAMMGTSIKTAQWYGRIVDARIMAEMKRFI